MKVKEKCKCQLILGTQNYVTSVMEKNVLPKIQALFQQKKCKDSIFVKK